MTSRIAYRPDIDGLRAVAVLLVVIYHVGLFPLPGGFVGVDVFFVISGYLITLKIVTEIEQTGRLDFGAFYAGRAKRLFPAMFVTLAISSIFAVLLLTPEHLLGFGASLVHAILSVSNIYFWSQSGYFDTASELKPLLHTWSLATEEQFYLLWPAILVAFARFVPLRYLAVLFAVQAVGSLYANRIFAHDTPAIFFLTPFRVFELAIGAGLVTIRKWLPLWSWAREVAVLLGLALIVYAAVRFNETTIFPHLAALVPCIGAALVILGGQATWSGLLLRNRVAVGVGLISYSLYLVHWPLIVFYKYYRFEELSGVERYGLAATAIVLAWLIYRLVEQPTRRAKNLSNAAYSLACAGAAMLLLYLASSMWGNGGWAWRVQLPPGELADFVALGGGEGPFHKQNYGGADCAQPQCYFGAEGTEKFVVIGDSHGRMYFDGLTTLATDDPIPFTVFEGGGCNFVGSKAAKCPGRALAEQYITSGSIDTAVLSQSWTRGNYETAFFGRTAAELTGDSQAFADYYVAAIENALTTGYLRGVRHLIIIGNVPQFAGQSDAVMCIARPTYIVAQRPCDRSTISEHVELMKRQEFNKLMATALANSALADRTTFLDPFDPLCEDGVCRQIQDGRLIYSDDDHLSKYGSDLVIGYFRDQIMRWL